MPRTTVRFNDDEYEMIENAVEESIVHENQSQLIRTAVRSYLEESSDDFDRAR